MQFRLYITLGVARVVQVYTLFSNFIFYFCSLTPPPPYFYFLEKKIPMGF